MFSLNFLLPLILVSVVVSVYATSVPDPCLITRKCSTTEETVYAVDERQCYLFRNPCIFETDMCRRREKKEKDLKVVTKADCKVKCQDACTEEYFPICAEYNSAYETFSNKCEFYRTSCQNDKSYIFNHFGACEKDD